MSPVLSLYQADTAPQAASTGSSRSSTQALLSSAQYETPAELLSNVPEEDVHPLRTKQPQVLKAHQVQCKVPATASKSSTIRSASGSIGVEKFSISQRLVAGIGT